MKQNHTLKIAFCGIMTALALVFICLGGLIPIMTYAMPGLAGLMLIPIVAGGACMGMACFCCIIRTRYFDWPG